METWALKYLPDGLPSVHKDTLLGLFDDSIEKSLHFLRRNCKEAIPSMDNNLVASCCRLFQSLFDTANVSI